MSKYPCKLVEDLIPLYIEGDVSVETKEIVEAHLAECDKCKALIDEYSNAKLPLNELQRDIPQANTFKKWMKGLKVWAAVVTVALALILIVTGSLGYKIGQSSKNDVLTLKKIVRTFQREGIKLKKDNSKPPEEFVLKGFEPTVFRVGQGEDKLLIYVFKSFVEREEIVDSEKKFDNPFSLEGRPYKAKNAFIVYLPSINPASSKTPTSKEEMQQIFKTASLISDIAFKHLNDGKELVYEGESTHWQGTITLKYYEHWWKDENGMNYYDSYHTLSPVLKYKMSDSEEVGPITFEYETKGSGGTSTGLSLDKNGYVKAGSSGSNGSMPLKEDTFQVTVKWNGKEEKFTLKAKN